MTLSFLLIIIGTGLSLIASVIGLVLSISGLEGWIIPTILFIIAFILMTVILIKAIVKLVTDPAKKARFLAEASVDRYAPFESEDVVDEVIENKFEKEEEGSFELVQANSKIFDKKFDTKAVGYWADAVKRFCRNKASLVCFFLLAVLILLSIFGASLSKYSPTQPAHDRFVKLSPKWPLLEKLGILDGKTAINSEAINLNAIVFVNEEEKAAFKAKYPEVFMDVKEEFYKEQDYELDLVTKSVQYDSRFVSKVGKPTYVERRVFKYDENNKVIYVTCPTCNNVDGEREHCDECKGLGEIESFELQCYYTVKFTYDKYAFLMQPYNVTELSTAKVTEYLNKLLANAGKDPITESYVKTLSEEIFRKGPQTSAVTSFKTGVYYEEYTSINDVIASRLGISASDMTLKITAGAKTNMGFNFRMTIDPVAAGEIDEHTYFIFGTDAIGRDMWARIWSGLGLSMIIGLVVGIFSIVFGICWGAISGYYGGLADIIMERFTDILVNVPSMIILTLLNLYIGNNKGSVLVFILALIMTSWVGIASRTRIQFYRYKNREYVLASRTMGAKDRRLIFKHILPNGIGPLVNTAVSIIPASMRFETSMSYLGIASMSENSIGQIISSANDYVNSPQAYLLVIPSIIFSIIMVSFSVMGLGLRDALNPALRGS